MEIKLKMAHRRGISSSFFFSLSFSRTQVVIKKSSNDNFFLFKKGVWVKSSWFELKLYHFEKKKLSFDVFLMTTWEQESESKKEPQIPRLNVSWNLMRIHIHFQDCFFLKDKSYLFSFLRASDHVTICFKLLLRSIWQFIKK